MANIYIPSASSASISYAGSYTFATLPAASSYPAGSVAYVTDIGAPGSYWVTDGSQRWYPENGSVNLFHCGLPIIVPPSGSFGNNGALSGLATNLPETFSGGVYLYFPANAIAAGVAAGLYYAVMSSTNAGTVYNNTYSTGHAAIPVSPTAFSTTGPGAYTQTINTDITLHNFTVPGNSMGLNGALTILSEFINNNSANTKALNVNLGSTNLFGRSPTTQMGQVPYLRVMNRGAANKQRWSWASSSTFGTNQSAQGTDYTVDTTTDQVLATTAKLTNASDYAGVQTLAVTLSTR